MKFFSKANAVHPEPLLVASAALSSCSPCWVMGCKHHSYHHLCRVTDVHVIPCFPALLLYLLLYCVG